MKCAKVEVADTVVHKYGAKYHCGRPQLFCEISTIDLSYVVTVKSTGDFVAFSEYMNFTIESYLVMYFCQLEGLLRDFQEYEQFHSCDSNHPPIEQF